MAVLDVFVAELLSFIRISVLPEYYPTVGLKIRDIVHFGHVQDAAEYLIGNI